MPPAATARRSFAQLSGKPIIRQLVVEAMAEECAMPPDLCQAVAQRVVSRLARDYAGSALLISRMSFEERQARMDAWVRGFDPHKESLNAWALRTSKGRGAPSARHLMRAAQRLRGEA